MIREDHRICINNYLVYITVTEFSYKGVTLPVQLECNKISRDVWFSECDRIPYLLSIYNNLHDSVKVFLRYYLKFDGRVPSAITVEFEPGETLYISLASKKIHGSGWVSGAI